jgi:hypothetical protein
MTILRQQQTKEITVVVNNLWQPNSQTQMEQLPTSPSAQDGDESTELAPLNIIRSETVLSKLPIHNLAKKGSVDINIVRRNVRGEVELKWEVSYNQRHGQARQL